jgi:hypothetical protein
VAPAGWLKTIKLEKKRRAAEALATRLVLENETMGESSSRGVRQKFSKQPMSGSPTALAC